MVQTWTERTHEAINGKRGLLLVWSFLCAVILEFIAIFDPTLYGAKADSVQAIVFLFSTMVVSFMLYPIIIGYHWVILSIILGQEAQFRDVFRPMKERFGKNVTAVILLAIFQTLWTLLFIVPGIVKFFSYAFTYFILRDEPELSVRESITKSRALMHGRKWEAFKLILPFIPIYLIGFTLFMVVNSVLLAALSLSIATILIRPFVVARFAVMYEDTRRVYDEQWNKPA
ncbi:DUF975 family protein [Exiguobacterium sp. PFWT01]|uniref:DUF975 family protein n=1 Tax=Exiguobacterium sp. PFWT01 TaxID=2829816 RepID=UPI001BADE1CE|nr:DUF975 family protein [Exiguobacterium sp. PFWT01]QUP87321.1 DUF975 family protein [Exiguobacterium sp. PFWT01]